MTFRSAVAAWFCAWTLLGTVGSGTAQDSPATATRTSPTPAAEAAEAATDSATDSATEESWSVVYFANQRVGYGRVIVSEIERDGRTVIISDVQENISMKRFGQQITIKVSSRSEETETGELLSYTYEMQNPPAQSMSHGGRVDGGRLKLDVTINGKTTQREIGWDATIKSALYQDRLMRKSPLKPGESRTFKVFSPELTKVVTMYVVADDYHVVKMHDGSEKKLLRLKTTTSALPGIGVRSYVDEQGESLRVETDLLGMVTFTVPREVAIQEIAGAELDVAVNTLIPVPNAPARLHSTSEAVYRIHTKGRDPGKVIPTGPTQSIKQIDDETIELTVTAIRPPENIQPSHNEHVECLSATDYLQTGDYHVQEHARKAAVASVDPGRIARKMESYVSTELKKKNFSTALASAAEVARNMEGDCTEHACLLAAMLRVKGIPSRVAVGLVYADKFGAFGGHMWTEAWLDGKWVPLDATLGAGGIGGGHIKMADSDMSNDGPTPITSFLPLMNLMNDVTIQVVSTKRD